MSEKTTIQLKKQILEELKKCKNYDRETYNEILKRLIKKELRGK